MRNTGVTGSQSQFNGLISSCTDSSGLDITEDKINEQIKKSTLTRKMQEKVQKEGEGGPNQGADGPNAGEDVPNEGEAGPNNEGEGDNAGTIAREPSKDGSVRDAASVGDAQTVTSFADGHTNYSQDQVAEPSAEERKVLESVFEKFSTGTGEKATLSEANLGKAMVGILGKEMTNKGLVKKVYERLSSGCGPYGCRAISRADFSIFFEVVDQCLSESSVED